MESSESKKEDTLQIWRDQDRARWAAETPDQREKRLATWPIDS